MGSVYDATPANASAARLRNRLSNLPTSLSISSPSHLDGTKIEAVNEGDTSPTPSPTWSFHTADSDDVDTPKPLSAPESATASTTSKSDSSRIPDALRRLGSDDFRMSFASSGADHVVSGLDPSVLNSSLTFNDHEEEVQGRGEVRDKEPMEEVAAPAPVVATKQTEEEVKADEEKEEKRPSQPAAPKVVQKNLAQHIRLSDSDFQYLANGPKPTSSSSTGGWFKTLTRAAGLSSSPPSPSAPLPVQQPPEEEYVYDRSRDPAEIRRIAQRNRGPEQHIRLSSSDFGYIANGPRPQAPSPTGGRGGGGWIFGRLSPASTTPQVASVAEASQLARGAASTPASTVAVADVEPNADEYVPYSRSRDPAEIRAAAQRSLPPRQHVRIDSLDSSYVANGPKPGAAAAAGGGGWFFSRSAGASAPPTSPATTSSLASTSTSGEASAPPAATSAPTLTTSASMPTLVRSASYGVPAAIPEEAEEEYVAYDRSKDPAEIRRVAQRNRGPQQHVRLSESGPLYIANGPPPKRGDGWFKKAGEKAWTTPSASASSAQEEAVEPYVPYDRSRDPAEVRLQAQLNRGPQQHIRLSSDDAGYIANGPKPVRSEGWFFKTPSPTPSPKPQQDHEEEYVPYDPARDPAEIRRIAQRNRGPEQHIRLSEPDFAYIVNGPKPGAKQQQPMAKSTEVSQEVQQDVAVSLEIAPLLVATQAVAPTVVEKQDVAPVVQQLAVVVEKAPLVEVESTPVREDEEVRAEEKFVEEEAAALHVQPTSEVVADEELGEAETFEEADEMVAEEEKQHEAPIVQAQEVAEETLPVQEVQNSAVAEVAHAVEPEAPSASVAATAPVTERTYTNLRQTAQRNRAPQQHIRLSSSDANYLVNGPKPSSDGWFKTIGKLTGLHSLVSRSSPSSEAKSEEKRQLEVESDQDAKRVKRNSGASMDASKVTHDVAGDSSRKSIESTRRKSMEQRRARRKSQTAHENRLSVASMASFATANTHTNEWDSAREGGEGDAFEGVPEEDEEEHLRDAGRNEDATAVGTPLIDSEVGKALRKARRESQMFDSWSHTPAGGGREHFDAQMAKWTAILQATKGHEAEVLSDAKMRSSPHASESASARDSRSSISASIGRSPNASMLDSEIAKQTPWSSPPTTDTAPSEEGSEKDASTVPSTPPRETESWNFVRSASAGPAINTSLDRLSMSPRSESPLTTSPLGAAFAPRIRPFSTDYTLSNGTPRARSKLAALAYRKADESDLGAAARARRQRRVTDSSTSPSLSEAASTSTAVSAETAVPTALELGSPMRPRPRPHGKSASFTDAASSSVSFEPGFGWRPKPLFLAPIRTRSPGSPHSAPPTNKRLSVPAKRLSIPLTGIIYEDPEQAGASSLLGGVAMFPRSLSANDVADRSGDQAGARSTVDAEHAQDEYFPPSVQAMPTSAPAARASESFLGASPSGSATVPEIEIKPDTPVKPSFRGGEQLPSVELRSTSGSVTPSASEPTNSFRPYYPEDHAATRTSFSRDSDSSDDEVFVDADDVSIHRRSLDDNDFHSALAQRRELRAEEYDESWRESLASSRLSIASVVPFPQPPALTPARERSLAELAALEAQAMAQGDLPDAPGPSRRDHDVNSSLGLTNLGDLDSLERRETLNRRRNATVQQLVIDTSNSPGSASAKTSLSTSSREEVWRKTLIAALDKDAEDLNEMLAGRREKRPKRPTKFSTGATSTESSVMHGSEEGQTVDISPRSPQFDRSLSSPVLSDSSHATGIRSPRRTSERSQTQFHLPSSVLAQDGARLRRASSNLQLLEDAGSEASHGTQQPSVPSKDRLGVPMTVRSSSDQSHSSTFSSQGDASMRGTSPTGSFGSGGIMKRFSSSSLLSGHSVLSSEEAEGDYNGNSRRQKRKNKRASTAGSEVDFRAEAMVQMLGQRRSGSRNSRNSLHSLQSLAPSANFIRSCLGSSPGNVPELDEDAISEAETEKGRSKRGLLGKLGGNEKPSKRSTIVMDPPTPILSNSRSDLLYDSSQPRLSVRIQDRYGNVHTAPWRANEKPKPLPIPAAVVLKPTPKPAPKTPSQHSSRPRPVSMQPTTVSPAMSNAEPVFPQYPFSGPTSPRRPGAPSSVRSGPPVLIPIRGSSHGPVPAPPISRQVINSRQPLMAGPPQRDFATMRDKRKSMSQLSM